jgi:hypothetical protein
VGAVPASPAAWSELSLVVELIGYLLHADPMQVRPDNLLEDSVRTYAWATSAYTCGPFRVQSLDCPHGDQVPFDVNSPLERLGVEPTNGVGKVDLGIERDQYPALVASIVKKSAEVCERTREPVDPCHHKTVGTTGLDAVERTRKNGAPQFGS